MNKQLLKANQYCRHGKYARAINGYKRLLRKLSYNSSEFQQAVYMLAYTYSVQAEYSHASDLTCLGVDLRYAYLDYYHQAALYLRMLEDTHFDPNKEGLPTINYHAIAKIEEDYVAFNQAPDRVIDSQWIEQLAWNPNMAVAH